jgi:hypothetical protein
LSDLTYPVRYDKCMKLLDERGFRGEANVNHAMISFFGECMHREAAIGDAGRP